MNDFRDFSIFANRHDTTTMLTKQILIELIEYLDRYERLHRSEETEMSLDAFASYLCKQRHAETSARTDHKELDIEIAKHVTYLYRYIKLYMKKVMKESCMQTEDEYTYLITLLQHESLTKTELNKLNIVEKTSGNEIIKRLEKQALVETFDDEKDRRSKRVKITDKGQAELKKIFPDLGLATTLLSQPLDTSERQQFFHLLERLHHFHHEIFLSHHDKKLEDICRSKENKDRKIS